MSFMTDQIYLKTSKSLEDYFQDAVKEKKAKMAAAEQKAVKTASANVPKVQKTATCPGKGHVKDEAESSKQLDVEPLHQDGESTPCPKKDKESSTTVTVTKVAKDSVKDKEGKDSGQPKAEEKCHNDPEAGRHRDGDGDLKSSSVSRKYTKIANLDEKSKNWLKDYWKTLYPADYVDAMLADK